MHLVKANHEIFTHRIEHIIGDMEIITTNIITLINKFWLNSFSEVESNKKDITEHGWFPYNQNILLRKKLCYSMTMKDI